MDVEFNPHDEFFCTILKKRIPFYDCKFEQENENEKCQKCLTGEDNLCLIKEYEKHEDEKPYKKRGRPPKDKKKLTIMKSKPQESVNEIKDLVPYKSNSMILQIDFTKQSRLYGQIKKLAERDFRDLDMQIMYMLSTWIDIDKKYEQAKRSAVARGMTK